jgi:hypothetical protein
MSVEVTSRAVDLAWQAYTAAREEAPGRDAMRQALEAALPELTDGSEISCVSASTQTAVPAPTRYSSAALRTRAFGFGRH